MESFSGFFLTQGPLWAWILGSIFIILFTGFFGAPLFVWAIVGAALLVGFGVPEVYLIAYAVVMLVFLISPIRSSVVSLIVMKVMKKLGVIPQISATERTALEAGVVWVEKDLFSGNPNFTNILAEPYGNQKKKKTL